MLSSMTATFMQYHAAASKHTQAFPGGTLTPTHQLHHFRDFPQARQCLKRGKPDQWQTKGWVHNLIVICSLRLAWFDGGDSLTQGEGDLSACASRLRPS